MLVYKGAGCGFNKIASAKANTGICSRVVKGATSRGGGGCERGRRRRRQQPRRKLTVKNKKFLASLGLKVL